MTFALGTLDADAFENCFGRTIQVALGIAGSVPDGSMLQASTRVTTTTPGDEPSDNQREITFQAGMLPVEIWFEEFSPYCDSPENVSCSVTNTGIKPAEAYGTVHWDGPLGNVEQQLGELHPPGKTSFTLPGLAVTGSANGGYDGDVSVPSFWPLSAGVSPEARADFYLVNPNPFAVPVRIVRDLFGYADCSEHYGGNSGFFFPGSSNVEDDLYVECNG